MTEQAEQSAPSGRTAHDRATNRWGPTAAWLRVDLRHRARSLVGLALLIALSCATVLAALAGARRGQSTIGRLESRTRPATVAVLANTPGFDWTRVQRLAEVEALTRFVVDYDLRLKGLPAEALDFPPGDANTMRTVEKPVIYSGRLFDPNRPDEVVVSRAFVSHFHRGVGDHVVLEMPTEAEVMSGASGAWHGPTVDARIVGVVGSPWFSDGPGSPGSIFLSPGLAKTYPGSVEGDQSKRSDQNYINALIRLKGGEAAIPQFRRDLARVTGRSDLDVWDLPAMYRQLQRDITFESWCLAAFAAIAFVAAVFLAGQAVSRFVDADVEDLRTVQALGMTRTEAVVAATTGPALAGLAGAALGVVGAYVASAWFPIGSAGLLEPSPGRSFDWLVLGLGALATVALVVAGVAWSARRSLGRAVSAAPGHSWLADLVSRGGWPISAVIGTRFTLEPGRGRQRVPVRPAIVGAVIGVLGITAAFTFSAAVHDATAHPQRFGQTYQAAALVGLNDQDFGPLSRMVGDLRAQPTVTGVLDTRSGVVGDPSGTASVTIYTYEDGPKALPVVLTSGRMPESADEIVLAPQSLSDLHTHVGAWTTLVGTAGTARFLVTGSGFVPTGAHNIYSQGGWTTPAGFDRVVKGFKFDNILVSLERGHAGPADVTALTKAVVTKDKALQGFELDPPDPLTQVAELGNVQRLPLYLGIFLVVLALGAIGHALATAVRRRSQDLAVLRALGLTPGQCRRVVIVQSTLLGLIGLVVGLPVGLAVGRLIWSAVAAYTPLQYVTPLAGWELPLLIPAVLVAVNALGAWPGHRAARLQVSTVLRAE